MTAIVAIKHAGIVYMGGDSAGSTDVAIRTRIDPKVHKLGSVLIGYSGSYRASQLLSHSLAFPARPAKMKVEKFMVTLVADAVRECLKAGSIEKIDAHGAQVLIGYQGRIFNLYDDYQVEEIAEGYNAIGSGADVAMGVLYATASTKKSPIERIEFALQAAERFCNSVRAPFHIVHS